MREGYPSPDQRPKESDQLRGHSGRPCPWREQTSISLENHRWGAGGECWLHESPPQPCGPLALHWSRVATSPELSRVPGAGQTVQPHFLLLDVLVTGLGRGEVGGGETRLGRAGRPAPNYTRGLRPPRPPSHPPPCAHTAPVITSCNLKGCEAHLPWEQDQGPSPWTQGKAGI